MKEVICCECGEGIGIMLHNEHILVKRNLLACKKCQSSNSGEKQ